MTKYWLGKKRSAETKLKISLTKKGKHGSPSTEFKKGHIMTPEVRKKISESSKGRKHTEESKKKMSLFRTGMKYSPEHCANIGKSKSGIHPSFETRIKLSLSRRGEKSYSWKGGITNIRALIRRSYFYRNWRKTVFKRDNWTCKLCSKRGVYLEADHYPKGFAEIFYENKITCIEEADKCTALWDINNGRTLCKACHEKTDNYKAKAKKLIPNYNNYAH